MADRWIIKEITISGFRGFVESKTFSTSKPLILFDGPQRSGKSSTLVAIEWGLFGDEIAKKAIGIDERKGWKIRNTNSDEARVEIVLHKGQNILKIVRTDKKKKSNPIFYFELNGNQDTDEGKLRAVLGIQPKDYFSSVHLHQEIIRSLLTEEPRSRRDSLDRLLGLSELRNILEGIKSAKISEILRDADNKFGLIETKLNTVITSKQADIQKEKELGVQKGLTSDDFSETGANYLCETVKLAIDNFAKQAGITILDLPLACTVNGRQIFVGSAKQLIRKLRDEQPNLERQNQLLEKKSQLQRLRQSYKELLDEVKRLQQEEKCIRETEGDQEEIRSRVKELNSKYVDLKNRRNEIDKRAGTIEEAIKYFEALKIPIKKQPCPVCDKPIDDVMHLKKHLKELRENLDKDLIPIREEIKKYEQGINRLQNSIKGLIDLGERINNKTEKLKEQKSNIGTALGYEIKETEDPIVVVRKELEKIQEDLKELESAVRESNQKLNAIEDDITKSEQILKVLNFEDESETLLKIKETEEYKEVESSKLRLEEFATGIDLIRQLIEERIQMSAKGKLDAAKDSIAHMFKVLANRPDFFGIEIDPNNFEILAVKSSEKIPVLSIFNQGDLNCSGLSIFLGLGATQELSHNLGFVILDDPSQSLDSTHKENLVSILNSIPDDKQILISTSESDLADLILRNIVREKKHFKYPSWSDVEGAQPKAIN